MRKMIVVGILVSALAVGGVAAAGGSHGGGGGFFGGRIARLMEKLNLTDQQQDKALEIRAEIKKRAKAMRKANAGHMDAIATELAKPKPDAAKLHQLADQKIAEMQKLAHYSIDQFLALHATLSNEQRTQLVEALKKAEKRRKLMHDED